MSTVQVKLKNGNIVNVKEGSQAHKTYANSVVTNAGTQQQISAQNTQNNQNRVQQWNTPQPQTSQPSYSQPVSHQQSSNSSASSVVQDTGFSTNNKYSGDSAYWNQMSNMQVNGQSVTNAQAQQHNPLNQVNQQRNDLITQASKTGDWSAYNNWSAQQNPLYFEKDANGNSVQNKNYYANLAETSLRALEEARMSGDKQGVATWERDLQQVLDKYRNAPGMDVHMAKLNSSDEWAQQYNLNRPTNEYFNSIYNTPDARDKGYYGTQMWYENPIFDDKVLASYMSNLTGTDMNNFNSSNMSMDAQQQAYQQFQSTLIPYEQWAMQNGIAPQMPQIAPQAPATPQAPVAPPQLPPQVIAPGRIEGDLGHIYTPGVSANAEGYKDNQEVNSDAFNKYLKSILTGGF